MEDKCVPVIYVNLGGEMFYVLYLRLKALKCTDEKVSKVMGEIAMRMFSEKTLDELLRKKSMGHGTFKAIFKILIETSSITIPESSMTTLYDLMTMVFKYQVFAIKKPEHIMLVTLNHMDKMREMCPSDEQHTNLFRHLHGQLIKHYSVLSSDDFKLLNKTILVFFKELRVRVSVLLKEGKQGDDGQFIEGMEEECGTADLNSAASLAFEGNRIIKLGNNIYENSSEKLEVKSSQEGMQPESFIKKQDPQYKEEIEYLMGLIGVAPQKGSKHITIDLGDLLDEENEENGDAKRNEGSQNKNRGENVTTHVKAGVHSTSHLSRIMKEMKVEKKEQDDDLMQYFD